MSIERVLVSHSYTFTYDGPTHKDPLNQSPIRKEYHCNLTVSAEGLKLHIIDYSERTLKASMPITADQLCELWKAAMRHDTDKAVT